MTDKVYRGRFAPSPTGPLHFGSLIAAVGSALQARTQGGQWLVRMEDVDQTRCNVKDADEILRTLEAYGFEWDGEVVYQSRRSAIYTEVVEQLRRQDQLYVCSCSRTAIQQRIEHEGLNPQVYPGTCRKARLRDGAQTALRLRVEGDTLGFIDAIQGPLQQDLCREVGDFVLRRADGLYAYQLAVVVDDALQRITEVVRGSDLLDNTPRQIYLQQLLGYPQPAYAHLPVAVNAEGQKLSKQTFAPALGRQRPETTLLAVCTFLGLPVFRELEQASLSELWQWAQSHWQLSQVPRMLKQPEIALAR